MTTSPIEAILQRRSIRRFNGERINRTQLKLLLEAAMAAPSAVAKDPWRFVLLEAKELLDSLAAELSNGHVLQEAGFGIVVCGDLSVAHDQQISYLLQDCSAAIENLLLAAANLQLGACWLGIHPRQQRLERCAELLQLPPAVVPVSCIAVGQAAESKAPRTRYCADYVFLNRWGQKLADI